MRPELAVNEQTRSFIRFLAEGTIGDDVAGRRERADRWLGLRGSMMLMPAWARELTGLEHGNVASEVGVGAVRAAEGQPRPVGGSGPAL